MKTIFVTGTDTGVGKTLVSRALIAYCVGQGFKTSGYKPVASGAERHHSQLRNDDALLLMSAANTDLVYEQINPVVFAQATAPHIAAAQSGQVIDIDILDSTFAEIAALSERVIVEGAGGWQVPITSQLSFAEWVGKKAWPVLLVVNIKLGCINHARLTYRDILSYGNPVAGWVANIISPDELFTDEMVNSISSFIEAPLIGIIPPLSLDDSRQGITQFLDFSLLEVEN